MADTLFLSGACGFLGTAIANELLTQPECRVYVLVRGNDENKGSTDGRHIDKTMSVNDHRNMGKAVSLCMDIVEQLGVPKEEQFLRTLNAGHPGGMLPLDEHSAKTLHDSSLPANLYVADATILPKAMGNPPILTFMALAKKIATLV